MRAILCRLSQAGENMARSHRDSRLVFAHSDDEAIRFVRSGAITAVVWELLRSMQTRMVPIPPEIVSIAERVPLVLHAELTSADARTIVDIAQVARDLRVSLTSSEDLTHEIIRLLAESPERSAEQLLLRRLCSQAPELSQPIYCAASIAGKRRTTVREPATLCKLSTDALEYRLRAGNGPYPRDLLGGAMVLHTAWRCGVLGWAVKRAASEAGFASSAALSNYVLRHADARVSELSRRRRFVTLLETFARQWLAEAA